MAGVESPCCAAEEDEYEVCVDRICFAQPHRLYVPPFHYKRIPSRKYRWKLGFKAVTDDGLHLKMQRVLTFPECLGVNDDARWRWQWYPLSLVLGMKVEKPVQLTPYDGDSAWWSFRSNLKTEGMRTLPYACLKFMTPVCGKLALRPVVELLPSPSMSVKRTFSVGNAQVTVSGGVVVDTFAGMVRGPLWRLRVAWESPNSAKVMVKPVPDAVAARFSKQINIGDHCEVVATGLAEFPCSGGLERVGSSLPVRLKLDCLKLRHIFGTTPKRRKLPSTSTYSRASYNIGSCDRITVVPGHWIDPGYEAGAPGEREFNLEVANVLERQLHANGWKVLRPDRDAPNLSWEDYLDWVSKQALRGVPVLEIHGQGSTADYRGLVLGVIGDEEAPLSQELAKDFGVFEMDWSDLAVPRRGGVILESFNSDEVLEMSPWHRTWTVRRLANRIVSCIERASSKNRAARGVRVDSNFDLNEEFKM